MSRRQDSEKSDSSLEDDCISNLPVGRLVRKDDLEYNRKKKIYWNGILYSYRPYCFAEIADVEDILAVVQEAAGKVSGYVFTLCSSVIFKLGS